MDWIKKNYDQAILSLVALVLLAMSGLLFWDALNFSDTFASIRGEVPHNDKIPPLETTPIDNAQAALTKPPTWTGHPGSLFVSDKYIVKDGQLVDPRSSNVQLHAPVPNTWFFDHNLDILDTDVLNEDPDGDGFTNLDEWKNIKGDGSDATDPQDKNSHPAFVTKLRLVKAIQTRFRLLFAAYDGDPAKPDTLTFQINTLDVHQPTQFRKLGEQIENTKFKVTKFDHKVITDQSTGAEKDVSELTVQNTETGDEVTLVLNTIVNSPDSYALFKFLLDGSQFPVKKDKTFTLKPEPAVTYKLVDIKDAEALIESPKGEKIKVPKLEAP